MKISSPFNPTDAFDAAAQTRRRELSGLVPLWPAELADLTIEGRTRLVAKLERALRAERRRGLSGHFAYDLARHAQLVRALRAEAEALKALVAATRKGEASLPRPVESQCLS